MFANATPKHEAVLVYFDFFKLSTPAEVCWACSDERAGLWVAASVCPTVAAQMRRDPEGLSPTYVAESAYSEQALTEAGVAPEDIPALRANLQS